MKIVSDVEYFTSRLVIFVLFVALVVVAVRLFSSNETVIQEPVHDTVIVHDTITQNDTIIRWKKVFVEESVDEEISDENDRI